jgi:Protein of unknown function (DUF3551)
VHRYILAAAVVAVAGGVAMGAAPPAKAQDYTYCLSGRSEGSPGDCSYSTYAQCQASAAGRDGTCGINPRAAFARQPSTRGQRYGRGY